MELLILGGTAMLGRAIAQEAMERGHVVTCLARGTAPAPSGTRFVRADRTSDDGLRAVTDRRWSAVLDVSRQPGQVRRAVRDLRADHVVFISSANVYADHLPLEPSEDSATLPPLDGDVMENMDTYGAAKVACERAVLSGPAPAAIVRPALIGGPDDWSGRSGYWPWRFAHPTGQDVIVPDDPDFPCAVLDVRDLATWVVTLAEDGQAGVFNAAGPTHRLADVLDLAARVSGSTATIRPVPRERLRDLGVSDWMGPRSLPLWIEDPDWRGTATLDCTRARAAGLVTRPLIETLRAALASEDARTEPRGAGLTDAEERDLRRALDMIE